MRRRKRVFFFGARYLKFVALRRIRSKVFRQAKIRPLRSLFKKVALFSKRRAKRRRLLTTFRNFHLRSRALLSTLFREKLSPNINTALRPKYDGTAFPRLWAGTLLVKSYKRSGKYLFLHPVFTTTFRLPCYGLFFLTHRRLALSRPLRLSIKVATYSFISTAEFKRFLLHKSIPAPVTPKLFSFVVMLQCVHILGF